jgi:hypothetical protein
MKMKEIKMKFLISKKLPKATYAEKDKQNKWKPILKYLWANRKAVIRIAFWLSWVIKKVFALLEDQ